MKEPTSQRLNSLNPTKSKQKQQTVACLLNKIPL